MTDLERIEILSRAVQDVITLELAQKDDGEPLTADERWCAAFAICNNAWRQVAR